MSETWELECSQCGGTVGRSPLATVCPTCQAPWLVRYAALPALAARRRLPAGDWTMWRYREWLPIAPHEQPVTLGEGATPLIRASRLARQLGVAELWIKDESQNPTGSFKARGLSAAVTRALLDGARALTAPTAGNAGVALSAYGQRAGLPVTVFAPRTTPPRLLEQIRGFGATLVLIDGHIGDCGTAARAHAAGRAAFDVSTLREPYRIEGKKTLGFELAEQMGWQLPDTVIYPTGGGTGLIGMWTAFADLRRAGWVESDIPRLISVQSTGCAPIAQAFVRGTDHPEPWKDPVTVAAGLRVPSPLGGRLILRALRESRGTALAVTDAALQRGQARMTTTEGIDAGPEGGATLAALEALLERGVVRPDESVVLCNTGAGWLYRVP